MKYTEEQVRKFLEKNNDEWMNLVEKKYVRKDVFERIRDLKIKGQKPSLEVSEKELLRNPLNAFIIALTKQRNMWTKINNLAKDDDSREMALKISDKYDAILKALRNQLNLNKFAKGGNPE